MKHGTRDILTHADFIMKITVHLPPLITVVTTSVQSSRRGISSLEENLLYQQQPLTRKKRKREIKNAIWARGFSE